MRAFGPDDAGMQTIRRKYTQAERAELIRCVRESGERISVVAARLGISRKTAYNWLRPAARRRLSTTATTRPPRALIPAFAQLVPTMPKPATAEARLLVRVGAAEIDVRAGFEPGLLRAVVDALRGGAA